MATTANLNTATRMIDIVRQQAPDGSLYPIIEQLSKLTPFLQDAAFLDVCGRLARALLSLPATTSSGGLSRVHLTQADLASLIGATRESVNRWLKEFARRGAIRFDQGELQVTDEAALRGLL